MASEPHPFKILIADSRIDDLHSRLAFARLPDELEDAEWDYGVPLAEVKRLTAYWRDEFDWRKAEEKLNEQPQFMTDIDVEGFGTLKIHFVHQKSEVENAIPLLFVHGCKSPFHTTLSFEIIYIYLSWTYRNSWETLHRSSSI